MALIRKKIWLFELFPSFTQRRLCKTRSWYKFNWQQI